MKQRVIVWCAKKFPTLVCIKSHCIYYFLSCTIDMWAVWLRQDRWMTSSTSNCDHYDCTRCSSLLSPGQHCENSIVLRAFTQHVEAYTYMIAYCHRHGCISNRRRRDCAVKWRHVEWRGPHSDAKPLKPICWGLSFCCWHLKKKKRAALNIAKYGDSQKHNWVIFHVFSGGGGVVMSKVELPCLLEMCSIQMWRSVALIEECVSFIADLTLVPFTVFMSQFQWKPSVSFFPVQHTSYVIFRNSFKRYIY